MTTPAVLLYDFPLSICCQMARITLAEKRVDYDTQTVDIMNAEQFEPWYVALNPKAVVPTLSIDEEITTDTKAIVTVVDARFDGPALLPSSQAPQVRQWMDDIMGLHYGVLLYSRTLDADRTSPTVVSRGHLLDKLRTERPELAPVLAGRIEGNRRFQTLLRDEGQVAAHIEAASELVQRMERALAHGPFLAGTDYTLADAFATAALARFEMHGNADWWQSGAAPHVDGYYQRMQDRDSWTAAGVVNRSAGH